MDRYSGADDSSGLSNDEKREQTPSPFAQEINSYERRDEQQSLGVTDDKKQEEKNNRKRFSFSALKAPFTRLRRSPSSGRPNKFVRFLKKFWYVFLILVIGIVAAVAWFSYTARVNAAWSKAADYHGKADYAEAAKLLNDMPLPSEDGRLQVYAQTMLATRQLDKALPAYRALYEKKKDPSVKIAIGNIYNEQKKYDEAEKTYRELITANDTFVQAYVNLSTLYKLQGKNKDAVDVAKQGVKANPNSVVLNELLISMLLEDKESEDFKQAVEALKKINPKSPIFEAIKQ